MQAAKPLVFAFSELEPWKRIYHNQYTGAYTEIVRELSRRVGVSLAIVECPLARCLKMMEDGSADLIIGIQISPEREQYIQFLNTPYRVDSSDKVFYLAKDRGLSIRRYDDLYGLRIGIKNGAAYFDRFDADQALNKEAGRDNLVNLRKLAMGRLDTVILAEDQGEPLLTQLALRNVLVKASYRESDATPRYIGLSKRSSYLDRLQQLETAMSDMVKDGTLAKLYLQHYHRALGIPPEAINIR
ncbi:transporter substrate-binding domain-containing protein [Chitinivorax sp. B]|uniref:substrate-binding periplasmic protein n=1 Tax=Chitinivorax sp. B TaxID=2502235 RepID=UPI001485958D|nr:transporter substrate-binding domain-containing protein [Chitinivorax sp. B]